jgi:hypothetical protein
MVYLTTLEVHLAFERECKNIGRQMSVATSKYIYEGYLRKSQTKMKSVYFSSTFMTKKLPSKCAHAVPS